VKGNIMREYVSDIAFTPSVKAIQERLDSRNTYARVEQGGGWQDTVTDDLRAFLAERDSFYLGTANAEGQPYIQHRGGPKGFLKPIDDHTLAFADFAGNQQYITMGNLEENEKAHIFLMDYAGRQRIKLWGRAEVIEDDEDLVTKLAHQGYLSKPERAIVFHIEAWDINCPQHITRRFEEDDVVPKVRELQARVQELEQELAAMKGEQSS
jgi:hypothetical protein